MARRYALGGMGQESPVVAIRLRQVGGPGRRAPLLVVHDGPDYVRRGSLLRLLTRLVESKQAPPHHVALLTPHDRMESYSASARYARELVEALDELGGKRVGV